MKADTITLNGGQDRLGAVASTLCLIQCIASPLLIGLLPALSIGFLSGQHAQRMLALIVITVAAVSFLPGYTRHRKKRILGLMTVGLALLLFAAFRVEIAQTPGVGTAFLVFGGTLLVTAAWLNRSFCRLCSVCRETPDCCDALAATAVVSEAARAFPTLPGWKQFLVVAGPGLMVMLADNDPGCVITSAQSGAQWGYKLLFLQLALIPFMYLAQELTARLGAVTGRGHGELIRAHFGPAWAWVSVSTLVVACVGSLITAFSGLAGAGLLFGIPAWKTMVLVLLGLTVMVCSGSCRSVERIAMAIGAFELVFFLVAWKAHPDPSAMVAGVLQPPLHEPSYLYLAAANIGAAVMPWMVFYQQAAVVDKGLKPQHLRAERWDTALGAVITQAVMAAVLIATAATLGRQNPHAPLDTVQQIAQALTPFVGEHTGKMLFALGMTGAALVSIIVVSLTAAHGVGELRGFKHSLNHAPREAPWFYGIYILVLGLSGMLVASGINLVNLSVAVDVMDALLLPLVLGFLYLLARRALPDPHRLRGGYAVLVGAVILLTSGFGLYAGLSGVLR
ncbi:MAG: divalent metal cation transporter [Gammaproteobacteria bacterium]|nr:divalent metal cation transporter [Gammaproteobacteria bacterium]